MSHHFTESIVEETALDGLGYTIVYGSTIALSKTAAEREHCFQVILEARLRQALQRLKPQAPPNALEETFRKVTRPDSPSLVGANHAVHRYPVEGAPVEFQ